MYALEGGIMENSTMCSHENIKNLYQHVILVEFTLIFLEIISYSQKMLFQPPFFVLHLKENYSTAYLAYYCKTQTNPKNKFDPFGPRLHCYGHEI